MNGYHDEIVAEVRGNRAKLLETYGGIECLQKHMKKERPQLEKDGWHFVSAEVFQINNYVRISKDKIIAFSRRDHSGMTTYTSNYMKYELKSLYNKIRCLTNDKNIVKLK